MSTRAKVITFGIISGLIWSVIPRGANGLNELFHFNEPVLIILAGLIAGAMTGVAVSLALKASLIKSGWRRTLLFGLISLPLGAFIFGTVSILLSESLKGYQHGFFDTIVLAGYCGFVGIVFPFLSVYGIILFPLAVITTFALRAVIRSSEKNAN